MTECLIRTIRDEAKGLGARFLLAPIPGGVELAPPDAMVKVFPGYRAEEYDLAGPRERLRRLAEAEGMDYTSIFDALAADQRARNGKLEDYFFWCDGHLTPRAHKIVARAIAERLGRTRPPERRAKDPPFPVTGAERGGCVKTSAPGTIREVNMARVLDSERHDGAHPCHA